MYFSVSHIGASLQWPASSRSRMMCIAACLLVLSLGSLLVNRDSGSFDPTTGSCAFNNRAAEMIKDKAIAMDVNCFFMCAMFGQSGNRVKRFSPGPHGAVQTKFLASSVLPVPLYFA